MSKKFNNNDLTPLLLVVFLLFSCGEEDTEQIEDAPTDWDFTAVTDNATVPDDENPLPDEATVPDDAYPDETAPIPDDDSPAAICGNGFTEPGERCDFAPTDCGKINTGLTGIAECKQNCSGWHMSACTKKTSVWGVMMLDFLSPYILDESRVNDINYREKGLQRHDAFFGMYGGNIPLPPAAATETWSLASTVPAGGGNYTTFIRQRSFAGAAEIAPYIELEFPPGPLTQTDYSVNSTDTIFFNKKMVRVRLVDASAGSPCILAMGFWGTVAVQEAWQANPVEGGRIRLNSNNIEFYPPRELPNLVLEEGDPLPDDLLQIMKYPACP